MIQNIDDTTDALASNSKTRHERDGLFVRYQDYYHKIPYANILYVEAESCYCSIYLRTQTTPLTVVKRLAEFEEFLPERLFVRVHRSYIVSLRDITKFVGNTVWLGDRAFPIGGKYRDDFLSRLDIL